MNEAQEKAGERDPVSVEPIMIELTAYYAVQPPGARQGEPPALLLAQDAYYKDGSSLSPEEQAAINYDHPEAYDTSLLVQDLRDLKAGRPVPHLTYDHGTCSRKVLSTCPLSPSLRRPWSTKMHVS